MVVIKNGIYGEQPVIRTQNARKRETSVEKLFVFKQ